MPSPVMMEEGASDHRGCILPLVLLTVSLSPLYMWYMSPVASLVSKHGPQTHSISITQEPESEVLRVLLKSGQV